jgi:hypothetical protein
VADKTDKDNDGKVGDKSERTRIVSLQQLSLYVLLMEQLQNVDLDVLMREFSEEVNAAEERLHNSTPHTPRDDGSAAGSNDGDTGSDAAEQAAPPQPHTHTHSHRLSLPQEEEGHAVSEKRQESPDPSNTDSDLVFNAFRAAVCGQLSTQGTPDVVQEKVMTVLRR